MEIKIVIPSHKRWDRVKAKRVFPGGILCVSESQGELYRQHNPGMEIVTHPDDVLGVGKKKDWVRKHFGNVFMVDDDIASMRRLYLPVGDERGQGEEFHERVSPELAPILVQKTAEIARDMGAFLFAFSSQADQRSYKPQKPFRFTGYMNGYAIGVLEGSKLTFDWEGTACVDFFISLLNAYYYRYCYVNERYGFTQSDTFHNKGGLADFRTKETEKRDTELLKKYFGDVIEFKKKKGGVRGRQTHEFERVVKLPY